MSIVGVFGVNVSGDIGATGISRYHIMRSDGTTLVPADCNAAAAAIMAFYTANKSNIASAVTWTMQSQVANIDETTAELFSYVNITSVPAPVTGSATGSYAGGNGVRVDWLTSVVRNRRLMRAANFLVPCGGAAFSTNGAVAPAAQTSIGSAASTLLGALTTASLTLVAYHRPAKGTYTGGLASPVTAYRIPSTPATLRSRRT